jgi:fluoroquinolone transport system permease protein
LVAFFIPLPYQWLAGVVPSYWPMRALWSAAEGTGPWAVLAAGTLVNLFALGLMGRLIQRRLLRRG